MIDLAILGPDLARLVENLPSEAVSLKPITGLAAPALGRATFRIRLADGTRYKGRRMDSAADARRVYSLGCRLDPTGFSRPIAVNGAGLIETWIDGRVAHENEASGVLRRCGYLLGTVHALSAEHDPSAAAWTPTRRLADVLGRLDVLAAEGHISRRRQARLVELARSSCPEAASTGVIHRDLWPRNVIIDRDGLPWIVDNGNVSYGAHGFDLARTAYLWPMTRVQRDAFLDGYAGAGLAIPTDGSFWRIDVLSDAALFRIRSGARGATRPLARLSEIAA